MNGVATRVGVVSLLNAGVMDTATSLFCDATSVWVMLSSGTLIEVNTTNPNTMTTTRSDNPNLAFCTALHSGVDRLYACCEDSIVSFDRTLTTPTTTTTNTLCTSLALDTATETLYATTPTGVAAYSTTGGVLSTKASNINASTTSLTIWHNTLYSADSGGLRRHAASTPTLLSGDKATAVTFLAAASEDAVLYATGQNEGGNVLLAVPYGTQAVAAVWEADEAVVGVVGGCGGGCVVAAMADRIVVLTPAEIPPSSDSTEVTEKLSGRIWKSQAAASVAAVGSVLAGASSGAALRLVLVAQQCKATERNEADTPLLLHPTQWASGDTQVGAVVGNLVAALGAALITLLFVQIVACTGLHPDPYALLHFPGLPLMVFFLLYPGTAWQAFSLLFAADSVATFMVGVAGAALCCIVPGCVLAQVSRDIPTLAHFRCFKQHDEGLRRMLVGKGDWVSHSPTVCWQQRYTGIARPYHEHTVWYSAAEFACTFALSCAKGIPTDGVTQCGHIDIALGCILMVYGTVSMVLWPFARARDNALDVAASFLQALAMTLMSIAYYNNDVGSWTFSFATTVLLLATGLVVLKAVLDVIATLSLFFKVEAMAAVLELEDELSEVDMEEMIGRSTERLSSSPKGTLQRSLLLTPLSADTWTPLDTEITTPKTLFTHPSPATEADLGRKDASALNISASNILSSSRPLLSAAWVVPPALKEIGGGGGAGERRTLRTLSNLSFSGGGGGGGSGGGGAASTPSSSQNREADFELL